MTTKTSLRKKVRFELTPKQLRSYSYYYSIWEMILRNKIDAIDSILVVYVGDRGAGKSTGAIKDAITLDPEFNINQICFTKDELLTSIQECSYTDRTKVVVFDEMGGEMQSRDWWKESQKHLVSALIAMRDTRVSLFACLPHLKFADYVAESLGNYCVKIYTPAHKRVPYRYGKALQIWGFQSTRKGREFKPLYIGNKIFHIPYINPIPANRRLFEDYASKKQDYIIELLSKDAETSNAITKRQEDYLKEFLNKQSINEIAKKFKVSRRSVKDMKLKLRDRGYNI